MRKGSTNRRGVPTQQYCPCWNATVKKLHLNAEMVPVLVREEASSLSAAGTLVCSVAGMQLMCPEIRKLFYSLGLLL